jgi:NitT/TauT family transport system ATP-binding protein
VSAAPIALQGVGVRFAAGGGEVVALAGIELAIPPGQLVCLLGPSGCGKSTLLNVIAGFVPPTEGRVLVAGRPVAGPGPDRGMVFQEYALFPWMTVEENVAFGLEVKRLPAAEVRARVQALLQQLQLADFARRYPKDLSGGMRQRVAIARVLALDAPILLMDEPFGALDALTRRSLQEELVRVWAQRQQTIVFVTHSIEESIALADRIVVMTYRPGTVKRELAVTLPRPRDPSAPAFNELKRELAELVTAEQARLERAERAGLTLD